MFASEQAFYSIIQDWAKDDFNHLHLEGSFRLSYNGSIFTKEGLGYLLTFKHLIDTSKESGLTFRPLYPKLETQLYLAYNHQQRLTPIAELFLKQIQKDFYLSNR